MKAFVDSNILIWHLRGNEKASRFLHSLAAGPDELWTGAMQRAEILFFTRPEEEVLTSVLLSQFKVAAVDSQVVDLGAKLFRTWHKSHGIDVNDALLAAAAALAGGQVYTQNIKHFPMQEIRVQRAWK